MQALTRAQFRDAIRHDLNKLTSQDEFARFGTGANKVGNPASTHEWPGNVLINQKLDEALSKLIQKTGFEEVTGVTITVPVTTASPQVFSLRTVGLDNGLTLGAIVDVRRVYWSETGLDTRRLHPVSREELDRDNRQFQSESPSTPYSFSVDGYNLNLYPGSSVGGALTLIVGTGLVGFMTDIDTIETLPVAHHIAVQHLATSLVAATQVTDDEMMSAAQSYGALGADGIAEIKKWLTKKNVEQQRTMALKTQATYYYGRR